MILAGLSILTVIVGIYLLPFLLNLIFRNKEAILFEGRKVVIINNPLIYFIAFTTGLFNTSTIYVNSKFSKLLIENEYKITLYHEIAHIVKGHVLYNTILLSLEVGVMVFIIQIFDFNEQMAILSVFGLRYFYKYVYGNLFRLAHYKMEHEADLYAYAKTKLSASILDWYEKIERFRSSKTHPSINDRMDKISSVMIKK